MNILQGIAATLAGLGGCLVALVYAFQEHLLYFPAIPVRQYGEDPSDHLMPFEDVELVTEDGVRLHAWFIRRPDSQNSATFVYFHGNAGNIGHRLPDVRQFYDSGFNVFIVSYRGYGDSAGKPSEKGFRLDARAALAYCADRMDVLDTKKIFLFGRSIGGAVAIATAAGPKGDDLAGIVVENTFTSIDNMIDVVLPPLKFFKFLNRNPWNSLTDISSVESPILFISGLRDELVPPAHMTKLYEAATKSRKKAFFTVANGTHNDTWFRGGHAYREAIRNFVSEISQSYLLKGDVARPSREQCQ